MDVELYGLVEWFSGEPEAEENVGASGLSEHLPAAGRLVYWPAAG